MGRVRKSPCELKKKHFSLTLKQRGRVPQGRPLCVVIAVGSIPLVVTVTKAAESKGESRRNRTNMEQ